MAAKKETKTGAELATVAAPPPKYAVTSQDLMAGRNKVHIEGRGDARVEQLITVGHDPMGGIKVTHENGASCAYENTPGLVTLIGRDTVPIEPWMRIPEPEQWVSLYVGRGGLAARVYAEGIYNVYSSRGDWQEGKGTDVADAKRRAIEVLRTYGADVSVLEE